MSDDWVTELRDIHRPDSYNFDRITTACSECEGWWPCETTQLLDRIGQLTRERDETRVENQRLREALEGMVSCHGLPSSQACGHLEQALRVLGATG